MNENQMLEKVDDRAEGLTRWETIERHPKPKAKNTALPNGRRAAGHSVPKTIRIAKFSARCGTCLYRNWA